MAETIGDEEYRALAAFRRALRGFLRFSEAAAAAAGLTAQQHQALLAIRAAPQERMPVGALAEALLIRPHSASGLADRLARQGLVERAPAAGDRRRVELRLTPAGDALLASLSHAHRVELRRLRPLLEELIESV